MTAPEEARAATPLGDVERIAHVGWALWRTALIGGGPTLVELFDRMRTPRVGDLVVERTWMRRAVDPDGVGYLRDTSASVVDPLDRTFVIEPLHRPGHRVTWRNAEFFALPEGTTDVFEWARR